MSQCSQCIAYVCSVPVRHQQRQVHIGGRYVAKLPGNVST